MSNVWVQVKRGHTWENHVLVADSVTANVVARLEARFGIGNVRVNPIARRRLSDECSCIDVDGKMMELCPRHARELHRRVQLRVEAFATAMEKDSVKQPHGDAKAVLLIWADRMRKDMKR